MFDSMTFADMLDGKLAALVAQGFKVQHIFATAADIERLFVARGDGAVLLDCDPGQDRAWYGAYELVPALEADQTMVMYGQGETSWVKELQALPDATPFAQVA